MSNDSTTPSAAPLPIRTAHDGLALPAMGFGTYQVRGFAGAQAIASALENGYRLLDTAVNYENEGTVGKAIRMASVPRDDIIVTSKLPGRFHQYDKARICIEESLCRLGLDYLDLYLIHWPNPSQGLYVEAWQALVDAQRDGLIRHIGVSNFLPGHIDMLIRATAMTPSVNQIELHPYFPQASALAYHEQIGVRTESWSPLGRKWRIVEDPAIVALAAEAGVSPSRLILRWHYQLGTMPLPKSGNPERQRENLDIFSFSLSPEQMAAISTLGRPDGRQADQNPEYYEEF